MFSGLFHGRLARMVAAKTFWFFLFLMLEN
jgi:hypothetical protein